MDKKFIQFPKDFLWGASISAWQAEGDNYNSDFEKYFKAGKAANHYEMYEQDFDILQKLNLNTFRTSIEWSRIESEEGKFNEKEIEHYRKYFSSLKKRGIKIFATLWHFSNPLWIEKIGGWENPKTIFYFKRFAEKMCFEFSDLVDFWITLNEPVVYASQGYVLGEWPPFKKNFLLGIIVVSRMLYSHKLIYNHLKKCNYKVPIGISKNLAYVRPKNKYNILDWLAFYFADYFYNRYFFSRIGGRMDFLGVNYYFSADIGFPNKYEQIGEKESDLSWKIHPKGLYYVLKYTKKFNLPVYITENGVADKEDKIREWYIKEHLFWAHRAIQEGVNLKGYIHWALIDNIEFKEGSDARFGLVEVDYENNFIRKIRNSAYFYSKIVKEGGFYYP